MSVRLIAPPHVGTLGRRRKSMPALVLSTWVLSCTLLCCDSKEPKRAFQNAEFGVLYGGQIQERAEIPFVIDGTKQQQGFRVVFPDPLSEPTEVRWELSRPGSRQKSGVKDPDDRVTELGVATVPVGANDFEQRFPFRAGDPLGLWNIRVTVGSELAIDRPFEVFDRVARKRARKSARRPDAGH